MKFKSNSRLVTRILSLLALAFTPAPNISHAQTLTYGVVAGSPLTNDYGHRETFYINPVTGNVGDFAETSASRGFLMGGALVEWQFPQRLSVEADALYRALHFNRTQFGPRDTVLTWELPVLLKYSFKEAAGLHPFVEAGPAFRATGNLNSNPSHDGFSAGAGLGIHVHFLDVAPGIRYTRWQGDRDNLIVTKSDQLELLVDFTRTFKFHAKRP